MKAPSLEVVVLNDYATLNGGSTAVAIASALGLAERGVRVTLFTCVGPVAPQLRDVPNLEVIGNFPREFQVPLVMSGGVSAKAAHADAAKAFIAYMTGPKVAAHLKASGMEKAAAAHH